ncbi:MAG: arsenate reductase (glutaredoxin) [Acidobacteriota bacterium]|nr:arsenate reductase (glutaredoxin) [Acidobacteriota bacterium]
MTDKPVTIYHNPRCSKSRQTLDLIKRSGHEPEIVLYLEDPPSAERLSSMARAMGKTALEITRTKEALFKELGLNKKDERSEAEWFKLLADNPKLIERPIVVHGNQVAMGRPPEDVLDIL